ncbi:UNVERIFIED_CONTAM: hypothetical protein K2H54_063314, partial [Gekko kuhli]
VLKPDYLSYLEEGEDPFALDSEEEEEEEEKPASDWDEVEYYKELSGVSLGTTTRGAEEEAFGTQEGPMRKKERDKSIAGQSGPVIGKPELVSWLEEEEELFLLGSDEVERLAGSCPGLPIAKLEFISWLEEEEELFVHGSDGVGKLAGGVWESANEKKEHSLAEKEYIYPDVKERIEYCDVVKKEETEHPHNRSSNSGPLKNGYSHEIPLIPKGSRNEYPANMDIQMPLVKDIVEEMCEEVCLGNEIGKLMDGFSKLGFPHCTGTTDQKGATEVSKLLLERLERSAWNPENLNHISLYIILILLNPIAELKKKKRKPCG